MKRYLIILLITQNNFHTIVYIMSRDGIVNRPLFHCTKYSRIHDLRSRQGYYLRIAAIPRNHKINIIFFIFRIYLNFYLQQDNVVSIQETTIYISQYFRSTRISIS